MNERLKDLIKEADRRCSETRGIYDEILAELIVQECADWAARCVVMDKAQLPQDPHSVGWNSGVAYASREIKKHFGVE